MYKNINYQHWATWLEKHPWDWWATLTFKEPLNPLESYITRQKWLKNLQRATNNKIHYILITEQVNHIPHYHFFITNTQNQYAHAWENHWKKLGGIGTVQTYNLIKGPNFYFKRYIKTNLENIIYSPHVSEHLNLQTQKVNLSQIIYQLERDLLSENNKQEATLAIA